MESQAFSHWLAQLSQLSIKQRSLVQRALHEPVPRGVLEGALPHTQQGLSVVVHFDLPFTHGFPRKKSPRVAMKG